MARRTELRILVVDDMSVSRQILVQMLERLGVRCIEVARNGAEALETLARVPTDMVIADLHMPGMDGIDLMDSVRRSERTRPLHFVLTSGDASSARFAEGQHAGPDATLLKPFTLDALLNCVEVASGRI